MKGEAKEWDEPSKEYAVRVNKLFAFVKDRIEKLKLEVPDKGASELMQTPRLAGERGAPGRDQDPILAHIRLEPTPLLAEAYRILRTEVSRIEDLIASGIGLLARSDDELSALKDAAEKIQERFSKPLLDLREKVICVENEMAQNHLPEAWQAYGEARKRLLPALANDLLAAIGGFYLRYRRLDNARDGVNDIKGEGLSFAGLAENLVKDLVRRSAEQEYPVLIVGEERPDVSGAVIRLRFPAWDVWNLPLTAHEYGYLLAIRTVQGTERLGKFYEFCQTIRRKVDPSANPVDPKNNIRDNEACFLRSVQQFWHEYDGTAPESQRRFIESQRHKIALLQEQQHRFTCRLFADAFATLFGGPAYLYSLLHLRFWPNDVVNADMPPFEDRFVFALETLKRMDVKPTVDHPSWFRANFSAEIKKLQELWRTAQLAAGMAPIEELAERYRDWLDKIYECFDKYKTSIESTYVSWNTSINLEKVLRSPVENVDSWPDVRPNIWAVLNAAWVARAGGTPEAVEEVARNTLSLLDVNDSSLIRPKTRPSAVGALNSQGLGQSRLSDQPRPAPPDEFAGRSRPRSGEN